MTCNLNNLLKHILNVLDMALWLLFLFSRCMMHETCQFAVYSVGLLKRSGCLRPWFVQATPAIRLGIRSVFSESGVWERDYRADTRRRVEKWWHPRIQEQWHKDMKKQVSH